MVTASWRQVKASAKQAKGKAEGNDALLCVWFDLLGGQESWHMLRFALYGGFGLFVGNELSHVTVFFALFMGEGSCHTLRFASIYFVLVCFARARGKLSHIAIWFAWLRFALLCIALLCFASHCSFVKWQTTKQKHVIWHAKNKANTF